VPAIDLRLGPMTDLGPLIEFHEDDSRPFDHLGKYHAPVLEIITRKISIIQSFIEKPHH